MAESFRDKEELAGSSDLTTSSSQEDLEDIRAGSGDPDGETPKAPERPSIPIHRDLYRALQNVADYFYSEDVFLRKDGDLIARRTDFESLLKNLLTKGTREFYTPQRCGKKRYHQARLAVLNILDTRAGCDDLTPEIVQQTAQQFCIDSFQQALLSVVKYYFLTSNSIDRMDKPDDEDFQRRFDDFITLRNNLLLPYHNVRSTALTESHFHTEGKIHQRYATAKEQVLQRMRTLLFDGEETRENAEETWARLQEQTRLLIALPQIWEFAFQRLSCYLTSHRLSSYAKEDKKNRIIDLKTLISIIKISGNYSEFKTSYENTYPSFREGRSHTYATARDALLMALRLLAEHATWSDIQTFTTRFASNLNPRLEAVIDAGADPSELSCASIMAQQGTQAIRSEQTNDDLVNKFTSCLSTLWNQCFSDSTDRSTETIRCLNDLDNLLDHIYGDPTDENGKYQYYLQHKPVFLGEKSHLYAKQREQLIGTVHEICSQSGFTRFFYEILPRLKTSINDFTKEKMRASYRHITSHDISEPSSEAGPAHRPGTP